MKNSHNLDQVWTEFSGQIRSYLLNKVRQTDDVDDLIQDIFIKINNNLDGLKDEKKLAPWIYRIVRNSLTDYYRKAKFDTSELNEEITASDTGGVSNDIYSACVSGCLKIFIERLPEKYREPLVLSDLQGRKQKDIAKEMDLSYSGLKSRVQRGREMIKDMFIDCACMSGGECEICNPPSR
jgi:RNA polymerase sigma-70 factor (ECF subfamily)